MLSRRNTAGERFSAAFALRAARAVASALAHVHSRNVAHGDVYGHNILVIDATETVKLGDFGAASFYGNLAPAPRRLLQRVEVRAFGVLAAELATRVVGDPPFAKALTALADACLGADVSKRPGFAEVVASLEGMVAAE